MATNTEESLKGDRKVVLDALKDGKVRTAQQLADMTHLELEDVEWAAGVLVDANRLHRTPKGKYGNVSAMGGPYAVPKSVKDRNLKAHLTTHEKELPPPKGKLMKKILRVMADGKTRNPKTVADVLGLDSGAIGGSMHRMEKFGHLVKEGYGLYKIPGVEPEQAPEFEGVGEWRKPDPEGPTASELSDMVPDAGSDAPSTSVTIEISIHTDDNKLVERILKAMGGE